MTLKKSASLQQTFKLTHKDHRPCKTENNLSANWSTRRTQQESQQSLWGAQRSQVCHPETDILEKRRPPPHAILPWAAATRKGLPGPSGAASAGGPPRVWAHLPQAILAVYLLKLAGRKIKSVTTAPCLGVVNIWE